MSRATTPPKHDDDADLNPSGNPSFNAVLDALAQQALQAYSEGIAAAHATGAAGGSPEFHLLGVKAGGQVVTSGGQLAHPCCSQDA